jgi:hypothetical protein
MPDIDAPAQCRQAGCFNIVEDGEGYCRKDGGRERLKAEIRKLAASAPVPTPPVAAPPKFRPRKAPRPMTAADLKIRKRSDGKRQALWGKNGAPVGTGLSRFLRGGKTRNERFRDDIKNLDVFLKRCDKIGFNGGRLLRRVREGDQDAMAQRDCILAGFDPDTLMPID